VPGKITYIGTLWLDVSKDGEIKIKELYEPEEAKQQVLQRFAGTEWEAREFASAPPTPGPPSVGKLPAPGRQPPPPGRKRVPF
jgi:hypothetical protein